MNQKVNTEEDLRQRKELIQKVIDRMSDKSFEFRLRSLLMDRDPQFCAPPPVVKVIPMPFVNQYV